MLPAVLPDLIALVPAPPGAAIFRGDQPNKDAAACDGRGVCRRVSRDEAREIFSSGQALVAHAAFVAGRLKAAPSRPLFDVLELFAFVRPGQPVVPSALGLARLTGVEPPHTPEEAARALHAVARKLLEEAHDFSIEARARIAPLLDTLKRAGWRWAPLLEAADTEQTLQGSPIAGLEAWRGLPVWEDEAPVGTPGSDPVSPDEAKARLAKLVGNPRPEQAA